MFTFTSKFITEVNMIIALCLLSREIESCTPESYELFENCPGSGFIGALKELAEKEKIQVLPGFEVLCGVQNKTIDPSHVYILQEELTVVGQTLNELGCHPFAVYCMESPLYTEFYQHLTSITHFKHKILFHLGTEQLYFPSYAERDLLKSSEIVPWEERKLMGWVLSNKWPESKDPNSLIPIRMRIFNHFSGMPDVKIGGKGWTPDCSVLNKRDFLKDCKYTMCIENYEMHGYVTEKVIHAMVAGTVPAYIGAHNVYNLVSASLWTKPIGGDISLNDFSAVATRKPQAFCEYMISENNAWLKSENGQKFRYDYLAKRILTLLP